MTSQWAWLLAQITRRIWVRASLFCVLATVTAFVGVFFSGFIPDDLPTKIGADAVDHILGILAASMLSVTTFSLGIMVSAYSAAANNVTPRATQLIMQDATSQNVLSTFIGSFLYSLASIIVLSTGAYGGRGRVILFAVTIAVIALIIVTLLRWIDHLSKLGHVTETTKKVEIATCKAMREYRRNLHWGCHPIIDRQRTGHMHTGVYSALIGFVQHIDVPALSKVANSHSVSVFVEAVPGQFVEPSRPLMWLDRALTPSAQSALAKCFSIGDARSFDQDPRFGMCVLAEIASRALSPGLNDPGTAIDVISRSVRLLALWADPVDDAAETVLHPQLYMPAVEGADLFDDIFTPISRDGASILEVGIKLQNTFYALSQLGGGVFANDCHRHSQLALSRSEVGLAIEEDRTIIRQLAARVSSPTVQG